MFTHSNARLPLHTICKILVGCFVASALFLFPLATPVAANTAATSPTLQVDVGFDGSFREGYWTPVSIELNNSGPLFKGTLTANTFAGQQSSTTATFVSPWKFARPVTLPKGSGQRITIYVPFYLGNFPPRGVIVNLLNESGRIVATEAAPSASKLYSVQVGELFIGTLSDQPSKAGYGLLQNLSLIYQQDSPTLATLDASTLPDDATVMKNFDVIILANFSSSRLTPSQITALQTWINRGGTLIEVGGPEWKRTLGSLPASMIPVTIDGTQVLPQGTRVVPVSTPFTLPSSYPGEKLPPVTLAEPVIASTATLRPQGAFFITNEIVESYTSATDTIPLIVKARQGQGTILYLAVDPSLWPLATWPGTQALWRSLLLNALGDKFLIPNTVASYYNGPGQLLTRGGILSMLPPEATLGPWILAVLLLGYALLLGPLRLLLVRRLKHPQSWSWRIILCSVLVFSLLSFGMASYQKGASLTNNTISIIQMNQGSSSAHITTYLGTFVPNQGDYSLSFPNKSLVQPIPHTLLLNAQGMPNNDLDTNFTSGNSSTLNLLNRSPWTFHPSIQEQDSQLRGGLITNLLVKDNRLVGTIKNTLSTALSDAYVLLPHSFVRIGNIASGETQRVDLLIHTISPDNNLADQIAANGGLPTPYFPYAAQPQRPQTEFEMHMALLSALNGAGFSYLPCNSSCNTQAVTNGDALYVTGGRTPNPQMVSKRDPLLLADASATLIAWTDSNLAGMDKLTINNKQAAGFHESFLQMPFTIDFSNPKFVPSDFITGQVVDIQSYTTEVVLPGIYSMSKGTGGGITFEFSLPNTLNYHGRNLTIHEPDLSANPRGPAINAPVTVNASHVKGRLYNWLTGAWDAISFNQDTFTANATTYVNTYGQMLLYITPQDGYTARVFFGKPTLTLDD